MEIKKKKEIIKSCRYCLMCKHVCPSGSYSYFESDYPRGRALLLDRVLSGKNNYTEDIVNALYNCFLCGSCWAHCEGDFNLPEAIQASRFDITSLGLEPERIGKIKESLLKNGHPYYGKKLEPIEISYDKDCNILYYMGPDIRFCQRHVAEAAEKIIKATGKCFRVMENEPVSGKMLYLLGYRKEAMERARILYERIRKIKPELLIVSDPLSYSAFVNDYPEWGFDLSELTKVMHISKFILNSKVRFKKSKKKATLVDSEYLARFAGLAEPPRKVLKKVFGENFIELKFNRKTMLPTGEAAFIFNGNDASMDKILKRIAGEVEFSGVDIVVTLNAKVRDCLSRLLEKEVYEFLEYLSGIITG
ncbi:MAG: hypothetical protein ACQEP2_04300 [Actinomycetota bacterium]